MLKKLDKRELLIIFIAFMGAYILFPVYFEMFIYPIGNSPNQIYMSLDPSWVLTLNYANLKDLVWGEDFVFTYGPLSYLTTRVGWGQNRLDFLFFDLFIFLNFLGVFYLILRKSKNIILATLLILSICFLLPIYIGSSYSLVLLFFLIFWIRMSLDNPKWYYFILQISILILMFYIKLNTGLISFILFLSGIIYLLSKKENNKLIIISAALLPFVLLYFSSNIFNINLFKYIKNGIEVVSGYNEIMYFDRAFSDYYLFAIIIMLIVIGLFLKIFIKEKKSRLAYNFVILFLTASTFYVLYKQSFVRADDGHVIGFYTYSGLLVLFHYDYFQKKFFKLTNILLPICIVISFYFTFVKKEDNTFLVSEKMLKSPYIEGFKNFTPISGIKLFPNTNQLPRKIKDKIGNKTVDIYPWSSHLILENKLNFSPRPIFQAYSAYTDELQKLNFNHYNSTNAPEFIIYDFVSIDNRYPLFDETKVNLAILHNYEVIDTLTIQTRKTLLFEKKKDFKPLIFEKSNEYAMYLGDPLIPKENTLYSIEVYNNLLGKFISFAHHSPEVSLSLKTKNNTEVKFKTSKGLLKSGVFSSKFIQDTDIFLGLAEEKELNDETLKYYKIIPKNEIFFKDKVRIIEYKIRK